MLLVSAEEASSTNISTVVKQLQKWRALAQKITILAGVTLTAKLSWADDLMRLKS